MDIIQLKNRIFRNKSDVEVENSTNIPPVLKNQRRFGNRGINLDSGLIQETIDTGKFSLEEVLEMLEREKDVLIVKDQIEIVEGLDDSWFLLDMELTQSKKPKIILYSLSSGRYHLYSIKDPKKFKKEISSSDSISDFLPAGEESRFSNMYMPTGVIIEKVPQYVLGTGVLGRAYIHQNYIQILDTLIGNEYSEVVTHELFHLKHPEKSETAIRTMTKHYVGDCARYH